MLVASRRRRRRGFLTRRRCCCPTDTPIECDDGPCIITAETLTLSFDYYQDSTGLQVVWDSGTTTLTRDPLNPCRWLGSIDVGGSDDTTCRHDSSSTWLVIMDVRTEYYTGERRYYLTVDAGSGGNAIVLPQDTVACDPLDVHFLGSQGYAKFYTTFLECGVKNCVVTE